jgi:hypothetical protein
MKKCAPMVKKHLKEDMKEYKEMAKDDKKLIKKLGTKGNPKVGRK